MENPVTVTYDALVDDLTVINRAALTVVTTLSRRVVDVGGDKLTFKSNVDAFLADLKEFLNKWYDCVKDVINNSRDVEFGTMNGINIMEYKNIKSFLYGKSDYPSVLIYVSEVMKLETDSKESVIRSTYDSVMANSFYTVYNSVGDLLDSVKFMTTELKSVTELDVQLFNTVRADSRTAFNPKEIGVICKAFKEVFDYMDKNLSKKFEVKDSTSFKTLSKVMVSITEYMMYTVAMYLSKAFIYKEYFNSFDLTTHSLVESTKVGLEDIHEFKDTEKSCNVLRSMDIALYRDPIKYDELANKLLAYVTKEDPLYIDDYLLVTKRPKRSNENTTVMDNREVNYPDRKINLRRKTSIKLIDDNALFNNTISALQGDDGHIHHETNIEKTTQLIDELHRIMKHSAHVRNFGINGITGSNAKLDFIANLTNLDYGDSVSSYEDLMFDTTIIGLSALDVLGNYLNTVHKLGSKTFKDGHNMSFVNISNNKRYLEIQGYVEEIYRDIVSALLSKLVYIERMIAEKKYKDAMKVDTMLKLDFDTCIKHYTKPALSVESDITDLFIDTAKAYHEMYFDYIKSTPEFKQFTEVADTNDRASERFDAKIGNFISEVISKIISIFKAAADRFIGFVKNREVTNAVKWMKEYGAVFKTMTFPSNYKHLVLPFKSNIVFPVDDLKKSLSVYCSSEAKIKKLLTDDKEREQFYISLYPNRKVYDWFNSTDKSIKESASVRYKNFVLYSEKYADTAEPVQPVEVGAEQLSGYIKSWADNVSSMDLLANQVRNTKMDIENELKKLKSVLALQRIRVADANKEKMSTTSTAGGGVPSTIEDPKVAANEIVARIGEAINYLVIPGYKFIIEALLEMYKYLQVFYKNFKANA